MYNLQKFSKPNYDFNLYLNFLIKYFNFLMILILFGHELNADLNIIVAKDIRFGFQISVTNELYKLNLTPKWPSTIWIIGSRDAILKGNPVSKSPWLYNPFKFLSFLINYYQWLTQESFIFVIKWLLFESLFWNTNDYWKVNNFYYKRHFFMTYPVIKIC